jgi:hypothetical protein
VTIAAARAAISSRLTPLFDLHLLINLRKTFMPFGPRPSVHGESGRAALPSNCFPKGILVSNEWIQGHLKLCGVLLLVLAGLNAWCAYEVFAEHPLAALANGTTSVVITLGVLLTWGTGTTQ